MRIAWLMAAAALSSAAAADPSPPTPVAAVNAVAGYGRMMDKAMDDVLAAIEKNDQVGFVAAYAKCVKGHEKVVDKLLEAEAAFGHTEVKLALVGTAVERAKVTKTPTTGADDWAKLESAVMDQIRVTRERHRTAVTANEKAALEGELTDLMAHLDDLRQWADATKTDTARPAAEHLARLEKCHAALTAGFEREERIHKAVVAAVSARLNGLPDELAAAAVVIRSNARLPADQLAKIRRQREQVKLFLDDLNTATTADPKATTAKVKANDGVVTRVDDLLKATAPTKPKADPTQSCPKP